MCSSGAARKMRASHVAQRKLVVNYGLFESTTSCINTARLPQSSVYGCVNSVAVCPGHLHCFHSLHTLEYNFDAESAAAIGEVLKHNKASTSNATIRGSSCSFSPSLAFCDRGSHNFLVFHEVHQMFTGLVVQLQQGRVKKVGRKGTASCAATSPGSAFGW